MKKSERLGGQQSVKETHGKKLKAGSRAESHVWMTVGQHDHNPETARK